MTIINQSVGTRKILANNFISLLDLYELTEPSQQYVHTYLNLDDKDTSA